MPKRLTVLQPDPEVPIDRFAEWLAAEQVEIRIVELWRQRVPALTELGDGLLILGGRMHAMSTDENPWVPAVYELIRAAHAANLPTLGICLGHQLIAHALGGEVTVGHAAGGEEGAYAVRFSAEAATDPVLGALAGRTLHVPQSHNDVVTRLPAGAIPLGESELHDNQAMRIGSLVSVQFHPEASPDLMARWLDIEDRDSTEMRAQMEAVEAEVRETGQAIATAFAANL